MLRDCSAPRTVLVALVVAVLAVACGPGGGTPGLVETENPRELVATDWSVVDSAPESDDLTVRFLVGECEPFERIEVAESPEAVSIVVLRRAAPPGDCPAVGLEITETVQLEQPLGAREVREGQWP